MHKFHIQFNVAADKFDVMGVEVGANGQLAAIQPVVYEATDRASIVAPFMSVEGEALQSLADAMWEAGVRPTGALKAIAAASEQAGGQTAPWLMRQLEKFINQVTTKESTNGNVQN